MNRKKGLTKDGNSTLKSAAIGLILIIASVVILFIPNNQNNTMPDNADFSEVSKICELATLRCYYHDVAEYEKQPDGLFKYGLFQYGYKKMWIEYDGIVTIGIDAGKVHVYEADEDQIVRIYVPDAQILSVGADESSMSEPITDKGVLTTITLEEKAQAFSEAQAAMRNNAESDSGILLQAKNNAKILIKQYITEVGTLIGKTYKVEWINEPITDTKEKGV